MLFSIATSRRQLVDALQRSIHELEEVRRPADERPVSSGLPALDRLLPRGGFGRGTLVEWFPTTFACGTASLALAAARAACVIEPAACGADFAHDSPAGSSSHEQDRFAQSLVIIDRWGEFYPPAAALLGIDLTQTIVVRPLSVADAAWALDQSLRSPCAGAVLSWEDALDDLTFRRLQLAAEEGGGLGLLLRPASRVGEPSWADVRLLVHPRPSHTCHRRLGIELLSAPSANSTGNASPQNPSVTKSSVTKSSATNSGVTRSGVANAGVVRTVQPRSVEVEIDDETGALRMAAELAPAAVVADAQRAR